MKHTEWFNCYAKGWTQKDITPAAFAHPAKFAKQLIRRIYDHLLAEGYIKPGDVIADPFGGVALGAFWAMRNGLHWRGVELEEKFVELGQGNIDLWNGRFAAHFPAWGTAEIYQGDSRKLAELLVGAGCVVSSPPFSGVLAGQEEFDRKRALDPNSTRYGRKSFNGTSDDYGSTPGQLGSMKEGDFTAVIGSPPYAESHITAYATGRIGDNEDSPWKQTKGDNYNRDNSGNLGNMKEGTPPAAIVGSPAYGDSVSGRGEGPGARHDFTHHSGENATKKSSSNGYGRTEGNLGNLAAVVSSPPFANTEPQRDDNFVYKDGSLIGTTGKHYGITEGNIGNETGETFWKAAQTILAQCFQILAPGGVAVWVSGDFVRDGKRVEFGKQWLALCEAVGFVGLEHITAWKTEPGPVQSGIFDDRDLTIDRVSFFRRLSINRAMAAEHWTVIDEEAQAGYLTAAYSVLWQAYETGQTPPDQITEPELPAVRTVDSLRQYEQDLREYKRLAAVTGTGNKPPTKKRILDYAQMVAWKDNGSESFDVDSAILSEDVWIVQKPW